MYIERIIQGLLAGQKWAYADPDLLTPGQISGIAEFGTLFYSANPADQNLLEIRNWMRYASDLDKLNATYFDTTTLHTVESLLLTKNNHNSLTPATLLDLSSFVNGVVLFDRIFHLENNNLDSLQLNERLSEPIVISLPIEQLYLTQSDGLMTGVGSVLRALWYQTSRYVQDLRSASNTKRSALYLEEATEIKKAWKMVFDFKDQEDLWFDPNDKMKSARYDSDGPGLLRQLVRFSYLQPDAYDFSYLDKVSSVAFFHEVIDECNYRSLFNLAVSNCLGLQYMPNSFRLPFRKFYYDRARVIQPYLGSIPTIEKEYKDLMALYFDTDKNNLGIPFFLAAILSKISSLDEFFEELANVRVKAGLFRLHRHELDLALLHGNVIEARKLHDALQEDTNYLRLKFPYASILGATAAVLAAITANLSPFVLTAIGILTAASQFPREDIEILKKRVLQRQYWFLIDQKDAALALTNAFPKIHSLWNISGSSQADTVAFTKYFDKLAKLQY